MFIKMIEEPINMVMVVALIMLGLGMNLNSLPESISSVFLRLSGIMAPLVLLFIGLAVKIQLKQIGSILQLLTWRAGLLFIASALFVYFVPSLSPAMVLLVIVFPQSSCSFWPFAHMTMVNSQEKGDSKTFEIDFALQVLACSLPFSSLISMGVLSFPSFSANPLYIGIIGVVLFTISLLPQLIAVVKKLITKDKNILAEAR